MKQERTEVVGDDGSMSAICFPEFLELELWNKLLWNERTFELVEEWESRSKVLGERSRWEEDSDTEVFFDEVTDGVETELESRFNDFGLIESDNLL